MRTPPRLMPALVTPFGGDGRILPGALAANAAALAGRGIAGFLVAGSTGEGPYLEPGERRTLVRAVRDAVGDAFVLCGVSAESLQGAAAQAGEGADGGADAVLATTPTTLVRGRAERVEAFYTALAGRSPLPLLLYSVPKVTGWELPVASAAALHGVPGIAGMKDSGGDPGRVPGLLDGAPNGFHLYCGASAALAASVAAGARGGITASTNYAPGLAAAVVEASGPGEAAAAQEALSAVAGAVERHGIGAVKAAAALTGHDTGVTRAPLAMPGPEVLDEIAAALRTAGVI